MTCLIEEKSALNADRKNYLNKASFVNYKTLYNARINQTLAFHFDSVDFDCLRPTSE